MSTALGAAQQIYYARFDAVFFKLPVMIQGRIEAGIDRMGLRLCDFPHYRLKAMNRYRLRIGDYRVIYTFAVEENVIHLLALGHRRDIYRQP